MYTVLTGKALASYVEGNPVPSLDRGRLNDYPKGVQMGRNYPFGSATPLKHKGDDIVYSPNKYRETEGIKEIL